MNACKLESETRRILEETIIVYKSDVDDDNGLGGSVLSSKTPSNLNLFRQNGPPTVILQTEIVKMREKEK
jgi:hypothetical protein